MAMQLAESVYAVTHSFPQSELYALANQLQRAAVSVPSNIAEGHARNTTRDYLRFVSIAMGSLAEVETQIELTARLNYLGIEQRDALFTTTEELGRMLQGLRKSLQSKLPPSP
ncbi:MAG: four helix bundle protein [Hydrogenophilales bacterium 16-64-46]|nr:MAG: four helix bundle protein [Hydrogenophilales bacterium 12-64-13]OYZ04525.1 MAG: four helix bundle protein [Hydrogenophilales bacterium 16-64-46]OZA38566.1 MAG: four helix bundle protein [Hydrogenophilales bacterium 17-64-34]